MKIGIKKVREFSPVSAPRSGPELELRAGIDRAVELGQGSHMDIPTGYAYDIPDGYDFLVKLSLELNKRNILLLGTSFDARSAELHLNVMCMSRWNYTIAPGQILGYAILVKTEDIELEPIEGILK